MQTNKPIVSRTAYRNSNRNLIETNLNPTQNEYIITQKYYIHTTKCENPADLFNKLKIAKHNLIQIRKESTQLRTNYIIQRVSAIDIENNKTVRNTIRNINKIEQIIKLWKVIQFTTNKNTTAQFKPSMSQPTHQYLGTI